MQTVMDVLLDKNAKLQPCSRVSAHGNHMFLAMRQHTAIPTTLHPPATDVVLTALWFLFCCLVSRSNHPTRPCRNSQRWRVSDVRLCSDGVAVCICGDPKEIGLLHDSAFTPMSETSNHPHPLLTHQDPFLRFPSLSRFLHTHTALPISPTSVFFFCCCCCCCCGCAVHIPETVTPPATRQLLQTFA